VESETVPAEAPAPSSSSANEVGLSPGTKRPYSLPLNNPPVVTAEAADHMRPDDLVLGIVVAGRPRAYPWWILRNYHVSNDTVVLEPNWLGGYDLGETSFWEPFVRYAESRGRDTFVPLFVSLCEACSGGAAFIPALDGSLERPLVFSQCRSSGRPGNDFTAIGVYTVCDLQTHSRWHPFTGRAESGPLAGRRMQRVPIQMELWATWVEHHPDTRVVLGSEELRERTHADIYPARMGGKGVHSSYARWVRENPDAEDRRLDPDEIVLGLSGAGSSRSLAYPLSRLRRDGGFVPLEFDGEPYLLTLAGRYRALVFHRRLGSETLDFERIARDPLRFEDASGTVWNELGEAVSGPRAGTRLPLVEDSYLAEWADWIMQHPGSEIVGS
jgi:hypothetical protein